MVKSEGPAATAVGGYTERRSRVVGRGFRWFACDQSTGLVMAGGSHFETQAIGTGHAPDFRDWHELQEEDPHWYPTLVLPDAGFAVVQKFNAIGILPLNGASSPVVADLDDACATVLAPDGQGFWVVALGKLVQFSLVRGSAKELKRLNVALTIDGRTAAWGVAGRGVEAIHVGLVDGRIATIPLNGHAPAKTWPAHGAPVYSVSSLQHGGGLVSAGKDSTVKLWQPGEVTPYHVFELGNHCLLVDVAPDGRRALASGDGFVALLDLQERNVVETWTNVRAPARFCLGGSHFVALTNQGGIVSQRLADTVFVAPATSRDRQFSNATVVLVGDSGVGKTGLRQALMGEAWKPTDSTHARWVGTMATETASGPTGADVLRETMLWDLAGQPGYRLVQQLELREVAVALVVVDARSETDPFGGVRYWLRALERAKQLDGLAGADLKKFLVVARVDRGGLAVPRDRIREFADSHGFAGWFETSARTGQGIEALKQAIRQAIAWDKLPTVSSNARFDHVKRWIQRQRNAGVALVPEHDLWQRYDAETASEKATEADFRQSLRLLQARGLVRRLPYGGWVLLQPMLLDARAASIVEAARQEPFGLGHIREIDVLAGKYNLDDEFKLANTEDEHPLRIATVESLVGSEIGLREGDGDGALLVFPAQLTRDHPDLPDPPGKVVALRFDGVPLHVYATLAVRLAGSGRFERQQLWRNAVAFEAQGATYGVCLRAPEEGPAEISLFRAVDRPTDADRWAAFFEFTHRHVVSHALPGSVRVCVVVRCHGCDTRIPEDIVAKVRARNRYDLRCPVCDTRVPVADESVLTPSETTWKAVSDMMAAADRTRDAEQAKLRLKGMTDAGKYDVFLCHNSADRAAVRDLARRLRERGYRPWLDEDDLQPGLPDIEQLESAVANISAAAVLVGPSGIGPWQRAEIAGILRLFIRKRAHSGGFDGPSVVIPTLLAGAPEEPELPLFLQGLHWVRLRDDNRRGLWHLIRGITGERSAHDDFGDFGEAD